MLIGLVICTAAILAWLSMLETGKRVHDKSSLNRATDAAAYSAALIHARALNMHAYLNRAQLGHQLAMAHLIAVATTYRFSKQMSNQALKRNPPPSLIGLCGRNWGWHGEYVYAQYISRCLFAA